MATTLTIPRPRIVACAFCPKTEPGPRLPDGWIVTPDFRAACSACAEKLSAPEPNKED